MTSFPCRVGEGPVLGGEMAAEDGEVDRDVGRDEIGGEEGDACWAPGDVSLLVSSRTETPDTINTTTRASSQRDEDGDGLRCIPLCDIPFPCTHQVRAQATQATSARVRSTSSLIWRARSSAESKRVSSRRRSQNSRATGLPIKSPSKSRRNASACRGSPPNVGLVPTLIAAKKEPSSTWAFPAYTPSPGRSIPGGTSRLAVGNPSPLPLPAPLVTVPSRTNRRPSASVGHSRSPAVRASRIEDEETGRPPSFRSETASTENPCAAPRSLSTGRFPMAL